MVVHLQFEAAHTIAIGPISHQASLVFPSNHQATLSSFFLLLSAFSPFRFILRVFSGKHCVLAKRGFHIRAPHVRLRRTCACFFAPCQALARLMDTVLHCSSVGNKTACLLVSMPLAPQSETPQQAIPGVLPAG